MEEPSNWIQQNFTEIIKMATILGAIVASYISLREKVKYLSKDADKAKEDLEEHCNDESSHISRKIWDTLISRLDRIETKVDQRNTRVR